MKALSLIAALLLSYLSVGQTLQIEYPYQPDADQDELVGTSDLLELLTLFGAEWEASEILVDSVPLSEWILTLATTVVEQGMLIDSLLQNDGSAADAEDHCNGAETITYHGKVYAVGSMGNRCWFLENLDSPFDRNGLPIGDGSLFAQDYYLHSASIPGFEAVVENLGATGYYGLGAIATDLICPADWHVARMADFFDLALATESMPGAHLASTDWQGTGKLPFNAIPHGVVQYEGISGEDLAALDLSALELEINTAQSFCAGDISEAEYLAATPLLQAYFDSHEYDSIEEACFVDSDDYPWYYPTENYFNDLLNTFYESYDDFLFNSGLFENGWECHSISEYEDAVGSAAMFAVLNIIGSDVTGATCYTQDEWSDLLEESIATFEALFGEWSALAYPFNNVSDFQYQLCDPTFEVIWPEWSLPYMPDFEPIWYCYEGENNGLQGLDGIQNVIASTIISTYNDNGTGWAGVQNATIGLVDAADAVWHTVPAEAGDATAEQLRPVWIQPNNTGLHPITTTTIANRMYHYPFEGPVHFSTVRCVMD